MLLPDAVHKELVSLLERNADGCFSLQIQCRKVFLTILEGFTTFYLFKHIENALEEQLPFLNNLTSKLFGPSGIPVDFRKQSVED